MRVTRLEPRATELLAAMDVEIGLGDVLSDDVINLLGEKLASTVCQVVSAENSPDTRWLTDRLEVPVDLDTVIFSGGVSEYIADPVSVGTMISVSRLVIGCVRCSKNVRIVTKSRPPRAVFGRPHWERPSLIFRSVAIPVTCQTLASYYPEKTCR